MKLVPVTVTDVPPAADPEGGDTPVTVGKAKYVKRSSLPKTFVPLGLVTVTSTMPADSAGAAAVICVALLTVNDVAGEAPNSTTVVPVRLVPLMVTDVAPEVVEKGQTPVTTGTVDDAVPDHVTTWGAETAEMGALPPWSMRATKRSWDAAH